jgi:hypothetical protein
VRKATASYKGTTVAKIIPNKYKIIFFSLFSKKEGIFGKERKRLDDFGFGIDEA